MAIAVIGAGLAGSEAAWTLAETYGLDVVLFEMKKNNPTPAQDTPHLFAELVCSNSLKSTSMLNPAGVLKQELSALGSLIVQTARKFSVPAGETLAVDREKFSEHITEVLRNHPRITVHDTVVTTLSEVLQTSVDAVVVATGPLTADKLAEDLRQATGSSSLYFYDAIAPIVDGSSIDLEKAFVANRETRTQSFEKKAALLRGEMPQADDDGDYLNLPLNKDEYLSFVKALCEGDKVPFHNFEEPKFFNGCQPIEVLAESGPLTLAHGPMKGRGLTDPKTGRWPFAAVQLRKEKNGDASYNMVGFQTRLTWTAQKQIFKMIPGLENAEYFRMGSMHRNTYLVSPQILNEDLSLKNDNRVWLAGQVMGVEGYLESAAMGCLIGHIVGKRFSTHAPLKLPPPNTSLGCLVRHCLLTSPQHFTPMNIHWGLFDALSDADISKYCDPQAQKQKKLDKTSRRQALSRRAEALFQDWFINSGVKSL